METMQSRISKHLETAASQLKKAQEAQPLIQETVDLCMKQGQQLEAKAKAIQDYMSAYCFQGPLLYRQVRFCVITKPPPSSETCRMELCFASGSPSEQIYINFLLPMLASFRGCHALPNQAPPSALEKRIQAHIDTWG